MHCTLCVCVRVCERIHDSSMGHWCLLTVLANLDVIVKNFPPVDWDCWRVGPCRFEVALTFVEQLVLPFFLLVPIRWVSTSAAVLEVMFQLAIVATGNYAWINWVGVLPCIALFDDDALAWFYRTGIVREDGFVFLSTSSLFNMYICIILVIRALGTSALIDNAFFC